VPTALRPDLSVGCLPGAVLAETERVCRLTVYLAYVGPYVYVVD